MNSIPIPPTADLVVSKGVTKSQADRTPCSLFHHLEPEPVLETEPELPVLQVEAKSMGGHNFQLVTSVEGWQWRGPGL